MSMRHMPLLALAFGCHAADRPDDVPDGLAVSSFAELPGDRLEIQASYNDYYGLLDVYVGYDEIFARGPGREDCPVLTTLEATATGAQHDIDIYGGVHPGGWDEVAEACALPGITVGDPGEVVTVTFGDGTGAELTVEFLDVDIDRDIVFPGHGVFEEPDFVMGETIRIEPSGVDGDWFDPGPMEVQISHTPDDDGTMYWYVEGSSDGAGIDFVLPTDLPDGARIQAGAVEPLWNAIGRCEGVSACLLPATVARHGYAVVHAP